MTLTIVSAGSGRDPQSVFVSITYILIGHDVVQDTEILKLCYRPSHGLGQLYGFFD